MLNVAILVLDFAKERTSLKCYEKEYFNGNWHCHSTHDFAPV
jgi:hypothetical protein